MTIFTGNEIMKKLHIFFFENITWFCKFRGKKVSVILYIINIFPMFIKKKLSKIITSILKTYSRIFFYVIIIHSQVAIGRHYSSKYWNLNLTVPCFSKLYFSLWNIKRKVNFANLNLFSTPSNSWHVHTSIWRAAFNVFSLTQT